MTSENDAHQTRESTVTMAAVQSQIHSRLPGSARDAFKFDWVAWTIVALVLVIQGAALSAVGEAISQGSLTVDQSTSPTVGAGVVALLVGESLLLVGLYVAYQRLSERWQQAVQWLIVGSLVAVAGYAANQNGLLAELLAYFAVGLPVLYALDRYDMYWLLHNGLAVMLGIVGLSIAGVLVSPAIVLVILAGLLVWDHVAVNLSDIMAKLVEFSGNVNLPNYVVIPTQLRVDIGSVADYFQDPDDTPRPDGVATIIGVGDFVIPGLLPVSAAVALESPTALPVLGALTGCCLSVFVLRAALSRADRGLPALPWLNSGAIAGFAVGIVVSGVPVLTALGVSA